MSFLKLLTMSAAVTRKTNVTRDGSGNTLQSSATAETVVCLIQAETGKELIDGREQAVNTYRGFFPQSTTLTEQDRITVSGVVYEVKHCESAAGQSRHVEAVLKRVKA